MGSAGSTGPRQRFTFADRSSVGRPALLVGLVCHIDIHALHGKPRGISLRTVQLPENPRTEDRGNPVIFGSHPPPDSRHIVQSSILDISEDKYGKILFSLILVLDDTKKFIVVPVNHHFDGVFSILQAVNYLVPDHAVKRLNAVDRNA